VALQLHQAGHEIEGPMAIVILGGLVSSTLVSLLLIPPLASRWLRNKNPSPVRRRVYAGLLGRRNLRQFE
jgi:Cu/Ag efflux pump CusA